MNTCNACKKELQPDWKVCPFCGTSTQTKCAECGKDIQPEWRACPYCGTATEAAAPPARATAAPSASSDDQKHDWTLWDEISDVFSAPSLDLARVYGAGVEAAGGIDKFLSKLSARNHERALENGIDAVLRYLAGEGAGLDIARNREALKSAKDGLVQRRQSAIRDLREARRAVEEENVPESSLEGFFAGAARVADGNTSAAMGAVGGAALGTALLPGIGTAIGGAVGAMVGGARDDKRVEAILEAYDDAIKRVYEGLEACYAAIWNVLADGTTRPPASTFKEIESAWDTTAQSLPESYVDALAATKAFIEQQGPCMAALVARTHLAYSASDHHDAELAVDHLLRLYPKNASNWEVAADVSIESGRYADALRRTAAGLECEPDHVGLRVSRIEALAASGRQDEAEALAGRLVADTSDSMVRLFLVRGLVRRGDFRSAAEAAGPLVQEYGGPAVRARFRTDLVLSPTIDRIEWPFETIRAGKAGAKQIVRQHIPVDDDTSWHRVPASRTDGLKTWFRTRGGEEVLYLLDWTMWGSGKGGLVITNRRLAWKCMFEDTVSVNLNSLDPDDVVGDDRMLVVKDEVVDVEREGLAPQIAAALTELILVARKM
ncbi:MAG: zinc ribbon domain-containing protein [Alphaproteobacteria bacterium]|nr:zinc ribbon domain-containing protein [Alphaproteobacteria bacterium]